MENLDPQLEKYLAGEMTEQENQAFQVRLEADSELAAQLEQIKWVAGALELRASQLAHDVVDEIAEEELEAARKQVQNALQVAPSQSRSRTMYLYVGAVAAAILLLVIFWPRSNSPAQIARDLHREVPFQLEIGMGSGSQAPFQAYINQDYEQALEDLGPVPVSNPNYRQAQLALADAHLHLDHRASAIAILEPLLPEPFPITHADHYWTNWLLAVAYLMDGQTIKALPHLENVLTSKEFAVSEVQKAAKELVESIQE